MTLESALAIIERSQVPRSLYCVGGLGNGECVGISTERGDWQTYYSEKGTKTSVKTFSNESDAVLAFLKALQLHLLDYGLKADLLG